MQSKRRFIPKRKQKTVKGESHERAQHGNKGMWWLEMSQNKYTGKYSTVLSEAREVFHHGR